MGWYSQTVCDDWRWSKDVDDMIERIIKKDFGGDRKKYELYCDSQNRGERRKSLQRRHLVKQLLTEFDSELSDIEFLYDIPIKQILDLQLRYGWGRKEPFEGYKYLS